MAGRAAHIARDGKTERALRGSRADTTAPAGALARPPAGGTRARTGLLARGGIALLVLIGVAVMLYPTAASWFSARAQAATIGDYSTTVAAQSPAAQKQALAAARAYNAALTGGPVLDPFGSEGEGRQTAVGANAKRYFSLLNPDGDGTMARLVIPKLHADLPVYHGTSEQTLARGVGHLYGTSLPVGGAGTHAVLTGHRGYPQSTLFTHLDKLRAGDTFDIQVEGEVLRYQVDRIATVVPTDLSALQIEPGKDLVTLVTCTPIGINSHRLLVRGHRVAIPPEQAASISAAKPATPFPWWVVALGATAAAGALFTARGLPGSTRAARHAGSVVRGAGGTRKGGAHARGARAAA